LTNETQANEVDIEAGSISRTINKQVLVEPLSGTLSLAETKAKDAALWIWKIVSSCSGISSQIQEWGLGCIVRVNLSAHSNVCGGSSGCPECASSRLLRSSAHNDWVRLRVGGWIDKLSNERRVGTNSDDTVSTVNTVEPVVCSYFCYSVDACNLAKCGIVEANLIEDDESIGSVAAESQIGERP